ncbi:MAG TPA: thymidylate kinase [Candidatus Acidoferrum sp.]|nr:thymidylate kinase [Candidatus Acidoferrum sp.]
MREAYGRLLPDMRVADLKGKLIVIEGTDGVGRTTQINLLKPWLEELGHAVIETGVSRSVLAGDGIRRAKERNSLGSVTQTLFYATDFVDRLEREIVPALRAGFIVLTDRYIYSLIARASVRGVDPRWIRSIYSVALKPDAVFYLRLGLQQLLPRVMFSRGFDYWESGRDLFPALEVYESFCAYQSALLAEFERLSAEYRFEIVDATFDEKRVFGQLRTGIQRVLEADSRENGNLSTPSDWQSYQRVNFQQAFAAALNGNRLAASASAAAQLRMPTASGNGNGHAHRSQGDD